MSPFLKDEEPPLHFTRKIVADNGKVAWDELKIDHSDIGAAHSLGEPYKELSNPYSIAKRKADFAGKIERTEEGYELRGNSLTCVSRGNPEEAIKTTAKLVREITGKSVKILKD